MTSDLIDIIDVERRILRALKTLRVLPDPEGRFFTQKSAWPEVLQSVEEAYGYTEATLPRFRPTAFDVGDLLTALDWVRGIEPSAFRLIMARSRGFSFKQMGDKIGKSDQTAARYYKDAILYVWTQAVSAENRNKVQKSPLVPRIYKKHQDLVA